MIDRSRAWLLSWSALCLVLLAATTTLVATEWQPLWEFDREVTRDAANWTRGHDVLVDVLHVIEVAGDTLAATLISVAVVLLLWFKGHRRAAVYGAIVMLASFGLTQLLKRIFEIDRPEWSVLPEQLTSGSFPSGHSSWITSFAAVLIVLTHMLVRRQGLRRAATTGLVLLCLVVFADRILLARHYPSDVLGGALLSITVALLVLALYSPSPAASRRPRIRSSPACRRRAGTFTWCSTRSRSRTSASSRQSWARWPPRPAGGSRSGISPASRTPAPVRPMPPRSAAPTW
ncbi:phosphatase PAP2 family protein [Nocardioides alcanivorans]|uniref:phosphatase PAP2 family protein n=1 Tax=Nocardioides alcanivorans TaxID=2897352 RepID=UPI001F21D96D|nr:phosphatase PAP2 family protein [Nocardioides alcanivorans]